MRHYAGFWKIQSQFTFDWPFCPSNKLPLYCTLANHFVCMTFTAQYQQNCAKLSGKRKVFLSGQVKFRHTVYVFGPFFKGKLLGDFYTLIALMCTIQIALLSTC